MLRLRDFDAVRGKSMSRDPRRQAPANQRATYFFFFFISFVSFGASFFCAFSAGQWFRS